MNVENFDIEIIVLKNKVSEIGTKYEWFNENFKERLTVSVGTSMRYAEINELLAPLYTMLSLYNSITEGIYEEFVNSLEAALGGTETVNEKLKSFTRTYGYEMRQVNQTVYLLNEEKADLEEKLNHKQPE